MPTTAARLVHFTESVIREMNRVAEQYRAINLAQVGERLLCLPDLL